MKKPIKKSSAKPAKKQAVKKPATKKAVAKTSKAAPKETLVGKVSHYFDKIEVAALKLAAPLKKGDTIRVEGGDTSFTQKVASLQREHEKIAQAKKGDEVGIKVKKKAREGYRVFKVA